MRTIQVIAPTIFRAALAQLKERVSACNASKMKDDEFFDTTSMVMRIQLAKLRDMAFS